MSSSALVLNALVFIYLQVVLKQLSKFGRRDVDCTVWVVFVMQHGVHRVDELNLIELEAFTQLLDSISHELWTNKNFLVRVLARAHLKQLFTNPLSIAPLALLRGDLVSFLLEVLVDLLQKLILSVLERLDEVWENLIHLLKDAVLGLIASNKGLSHINQDSLGVFDL